jgi:hypothetical protein
MRTSRAEPVARCRRAAVALQHHILAANAHEDFARSKPDETAVAPENPNSRQHFAR